ncbi:MAG: hypothetical protein KDC30_02630, partial [Saprospiraceae bacterium]|nr:hypothetical protein [Saprospiraceae bacterium]
PKVADEVSDHYSYYRAKDTESLGDVGRRSEWHSDIFAGVHAGCWILDTNAGFARRPDLVGIGEGGDADLP